MQRVPGSQEGSGPEFFALMYTEPFSYRTQFTTTSGSGNDKGGSHAVAFGGDCSKQIKGSDRPSSGFGRSAGRGKFEDVVYLDQMYPEVAAEIGRVKEDIILFWTYQFSRSEVKSERFGGWLLLRHRLGSVTTILGDTSIRIRIGGQNMLRSLSILLISFYCRSVAAAADPCEFPDPEAQPFSFLLHDSYIAEGSFFGVFELENRGAKHVAISGRRKEGIFTSGRPDVSIQFLDMTSVWQPMLTLPGSFFPRPDRLTIPAGGKARITIYLMSEDAANQGAVAFRVLIRSFDPPTCIASVPFAPLPRRPRVTGFESSQDLVPH